MTLLTREDFNTDTPFVEFSNFDGENIFTYEVDDMVVSFFSLESDTNYNPNVAYTVIESEVSIRNTHPLKKVFADEYVNAGQEGVMDLVQQRLIDNEFATKEFAPFVNMVVQANPPAEWDRGIVFRFIVNIHNISEFGSTKKFFDTVIVPLARTFEISEV